MDKETKTNRKINYIFIVLTVILIIVVGIGGWFLGTKFASREDDLSEKLESNENKIPEKVEKIDDTKEYIYDAEYVYEHKFEKYKEFASTKDAVKTLNYGIEVEYTEGTQYLENLKVPYINIQSEAVDLINNQIEKLYLEYAKSFEDNAVAINTSEALPIASHILTYRSFISNDILSVVIIYDSESTSRWNLQYLTYNIDLQSGNLLSYEGVLSRLGYDKVSTLEKVEEAITEKVTTLWTQYKIQLPETEKERFINEAKERLEESISAKQVQVFINNDNINIIEKIEYGDESFDSYVFEILK